MFLSKLRAVLRKTPRGANYSDETMSKALDTFISDMTCVVTLNYLKMQSEDSLSAIYFSWERTAIKYQDFEVRLKHLLSNTKIYVALPVAEITPEEESNVISIFTVH